MEAIRTEALKTEAIKTEAIKTEIIKTEAVRPTLICVTPVKNEAWIMERFLKCASEWADHIVVADQCSDDNTRAIAAGFPKVTLVDNTSPVYDEEARQRLLLDVARSLPCPGKRILIALDADEMLSADFADSAEWQEILDAPEGTPLQFEWVHILPDFRQCWIPTHPFPFGFVDDGRPHVGEKIHSTRLPEPRDRPVIVVKNIKVLHYQFTDWQRMKSKHRWYQCWEHLNLSGKRPIQLYRQYHKMDARPPEQLHPIQLAWLEGYERAGIDMRGLQPEEYFRWDKELLDLFAQHGIATFRRLGIWDVDWVEIGRRVGSDLPADALRDPRSGWERRVHRWLAATQAHETDWRVRMVQRFLIPFGW